MAPHSAQQSVLLEPSIRNRKWQIHKKDKKTEPSVPLLGGQGEGCRRVRGGSQETADTEGASGNKTRRNRPEELSRSREVLRTGVPGRREAGHEPWPATATIHVYAVLPAAGPEQAPAITHSTPLPTPETHRCVF